jgi:uncharacterized lipoprotein
MRKSVLTVMAIATLLGLGGCNYSEQKRQAREYEQFLKETLGTVEPDAPQHAQAPTGPASHID